jgi:hypothetical protein
MATKKSQKPQVDSQPVADDEWTGTDLFIGFPCYKTTNPVTAWCLVAMAKDFGDKARMDMVLGDAMIYHARNELAMRFLASEAKYLLFIDDDMIIPVGRPAFFKTMCRLPEDYPDSSAELNTAQRLASHGHGLVGATYFARHPNGRPINSLMNDPEYLRRAASFHDGTMECKWIGTGCMLIKREVFLDMQREFPELAPEIDGAPWNFFHPDTDGGEDVAFCRRAAKCGHQPHVDTMLHAAHVGYGIYGLHTSRILDA